jgi:hypothetical protein
MPMMPPPKTESPRPTPGLPLPLLRVGHATAQRKSIWIVGGGPSLRGFDFSILAGQYVLAVNDTFRALPLARGVVSIDAHWQYHRINALRMFSGTKWICRRQGFGGPGYQFQDDPVHLPYKKGIVAMANAGPNTNGSQFFIMLDDAPSLPPAYSVFGRVIQGQEVVDTIGVGDKMLEVLVEPKK